MGEIAEAMLDGTLCEGCGEFIGGDAGFPQYCSAACAAGRGAEQVLPRHNPAKKFCCAQCTKRFRGGLALAQHTRDKHGATLTSTMGEKP